VNQHLIFVAVLLGIMAVLAIAAWIQNWRDYRKETRK
jgi:hypothetical protein